MCEDCIKRKKELDADIEKEVNAMSEKKAKKELKKYMKSNQAILCPANVFKDE